MEYNALRPSPGCAVYGVPKPKVHGLTMAQARHARRPTLEHRVMGAGTNGPTGLGIRSAVHGLCTIKSTQRIGPSTGPRPSRRGHATAPANMTFQGVPKDSRNIVIECRAKKLARTVAKEERLLRRCLLAIRKEDNVRFNRLEKRLCKSPRWPAYHAKIEHLLRTVCLSQATS